MARPPITSSDLQSGAPQPIILDCDNMMGALCREIDDGLALCALLADQRVDLLAVTTTFGNGPVDRVHKYTGKLIAALSKPGVELKKGASGPNSCQTDAAHFMAQVAAERPGEVTLVATGPLTNLAAAAQIDPNFFGNLKRIVCMGGWRGPFRLGPRRLREVNLISDARAARQVLLSKAPVCVADGDLCRQVVFDRADVAALCRVPGLPPWMRRALRRWATVCRLAGISPGICPWDLVAAAFVLEPDLFLTHPVCVRSDVFDFAEGRLRLDRSDGCDRVTLLTHVTDPGAIAGLLRGALTRLFQPAPPQLRPALALETINI